MEELVLLEHMDWELLYYVTPSGQAVVSDFLAGLDGISKAKAQRQIDLLRTYGIDLGMPHAKALGGGLVELRVRGKREVRVFYAFAKGKRIFMLHGFIKKTQQTPKKELDIARSRQKEVEDI
jgi:phage-related protein